MPLSSVKPIKTIAPKKGAITGDINKNIHILSVMAL